MVVVSSGIEPESRASETLILSIVLRDRRKAKVGQKTPMAKGRPVGGSLDESAGVGGEDLDGDGQQDDAEELADGQQAAAAEEAGDPVERP